MKTILCDLDGVVCALHAEWLRRYNADYGDALTFADIKTWDMVPIVKPECGKRIYDYLHHADLYDRIEPITGALAGVAALREMGHRVVFVTSCVGESMVAGKLRWLARHGLTRDMRDVVVMQDKSLVRGDLMIDDYPKNLDDFGGHSVIFDAPYNQDAGPDGAWRANGRCVARAVGWEQVVRLVPEMLA